MAGRGPRPKPVERLAGHGAAKARAAGLQVVPLQRARRQRLPADLLGEGEAWHPATVRWWNRWSKSALAADWTPVDWSELEACAVLHHEFMRKRTFTLASEIRLRMAKFGATPEDRARLGIVFADADEKAEKRGRARKADDPYAGLRAVD
jgi:hypothetical protein